jgi:hypothetical protein
MIGRWHPTYSSPWLLSTLAHHVPGQYLYKDFKVLLVLLAEEKKYFE